jgi:hypothetical protein
VTSRKVLDFVDSSGEIDLGELLGSLFHILDSEIVSLEKLECINVDLDQSSDLKIGVSDISLFLRVVMLLSFKELSSPDA